MENSELKVVEQTTPDFFGTKEAFEHSQRVATMFSKSDLVPKSFQNNIGNCVIAMEIAYRMQASPLMVMQNIHIIHGKPSWSSTFLIASLNASGKFSPLRYEEDSEDGGRTRAWATDKKGEKCIGPWVSMVMAKAEGWVDKAGSKWKTMPELMRRYRAASFFTKQFAPEISMGFQTTEEIIDVEYVNTKPTDAKPTKEEKETGRVKLLIEAAETTTDLAKLEAHVTPETLDLFNQKSEQILKKGSKK